jgi:outer membrane receptor protein involved in Fe transport
LLSSTAALAGEADSPDLAQQATEQQSEQIVVTATQRAVSARDTAASVSVFTAQRLNDANVTVVKQLTTLAPSMTVLNSIGEAFGQLIAVRGVATSGADVGLESAVGITLDGVPLMRPNVSIFDLQGVDRIEFLRGPQGTLFGANTTTGLINVLTRRPSFEPSLEAAAAYGERDMRELRLSADGGIVPSKLAGRIDAVIGAIDGYLPDANTGNTYGARHGDQVRGQLLWTPTPDVDVRLIADYLHHGGSVNAPVYRVVGATGPLITQLSGVPLVGYFHARDVAQIDNATSRFEISDSAGVGSQLDWKTDAGQLTAIASHRSSTIKRNYDLDNSPADLAYDPRDGERYHLSTFELRFRGVAGPLDYLIGGYFSHGLIISRDSHTAGKDFDAYMNALAGGAIPLITGLPAGSNFPAGVGILDVYRQRTDTYALFTHHILQLTGDLSAILGARYSNEDKSLAASIATSNPGCSHALALHPNLAGVPAALQPLVCLPNFDPRYDGAYTASRSDGNWSGTAALDEKLTDAFNAYLSYSRGYKSGGYQLERSGMSVAAPSLSQLAFNPESTNSYEAGVKGISADGTWRASTAAFYTAFNNYQFSYFTGLNRRTQNVPKLVTKGVEAEAAYRPIEGLELSASGTYQEAIFGDSGFPAALVQLEGATAPLAPRWVGVAAAEYRAPIQAAGVTAFGSMDVRWQSKSNVGSSAAPSPNFFQGAYAVVGARLGVEARESHWRVEVWARNLFNQRGWALLNSTTLQPGSISGFVTDARTAGVTATLFW